MSSTCCFKRLQSSATSLVPREIRQAFTKELADVLVVDEADAITEREILSCIFRQTRYIFSFDDKQLPPVVQNLSMPFAPQLSSPLANRLRLLNGLSWSWVSSFVCCLA